MIENPALRYSKTWPGYARVRGWFRPYVEVGYMGSLLEGPYLGGLIAHEFVHMVEKHRLKTLVLMVAAFASGFVPTLWLLDFLGAVDFVGRLAVACVAGVVLSSVVGLAFVRRCERRADAHAAFKLGRVYHKLMREVVYVRPTPQDVLIYGTREQRLARIMAEAEKGPNAGYTPGGGPF